MNTFKKFVAYLVVLMPMLAAGTFVSCSLLQDAGRVEEMTDEEFSAWSKQSAGTVGAFARAAIEEGDLTKEKALGLAENVEAIADGSYGGSLADLALSLDLKGYKGLALMLLLQEMSGKLAELGGYVDGLLTARGASMLLLVADELRKVAAEE